jgi:DNA mismatch endonuclease (patch repair protein)
VMARIRSRGNRETELALARLLRRAGFTGWRRQREVRSPKSEVRGPKSEGRSARAGVGSFRVRPDFVFPKQRVAVFVDGCFWHGCPVHSPPARWLRKSAMPDAPGRVRGQGTGRTGKRFWRAKLAANRARDRRVNRALRRAGWRVVRLWEHELRAPARCLGRIRVAINRPEDFGRGRQSRRCAKAGVKATMGP